MKKSLEKFRYARIKLSRRDRSREELKKELDYDRIREEKIRFLENHHAIVLATSYNDRVTARTVTYASKGLETEVKEGDQIILIPISHGG